MSARAQTKTMPATATKANAAQGAGKSHKRSRFGCYTCRLRRKKCDEAKPLCKACNHLGLACDYKRPAYWSNADARARHKENIKVVIKNRKPDPAEVVLGHRNPLNGSIPDLTHSVRSDTFSDLHRTRSASVESQYSVSGDFDFNSSIGSYASSYQSHHSITPNFGQSPLCMSPYELDSKADRQAYFSDRLASNSSVSSFSSYHSIGGYGVPVFTPDWVQEDLHEYQVPSLLLNEEIAPMFDFSHDLLLDTAPLPMEGDDGRLKQHFLDNVAQLLFPLLELHQPGIVKNELLMHSLETSSTFMHTCLSAAAHHLKTTRGLNNQQINEDIMRHRFATIGGLCGALEADQTAPDFHESIHHQALEAALMTIVLGSVTGRIQDDQTDIPWHQHFQAVLSLVNHLQLPQELGLVTSLEHRRPRFNMTLTAWIDIIGATMQGRCPFYADTYRQKAVSHTPSGLVELTGCEDSVIYVISEVACLEGLKQSGQVDEYVFLEHISLVARQMDDTEPRERLPLVMPYSPNGTLLVDQLVKNITSVYRLAGRLYLCGLVELFNRNDENVLSLVDRLTEALEFIPSGLNGFDRAIVWPMLMGGYSSLPDSKFRQIFEERVRLLGGEADFGSYGRMAHLLRETWKVNDNASTMTHWRDILPLETFDHLLM